VAGLRGVVVGVRRLRWGWRLRGVVAVGVVELRLWLVRVQGMVRTVWGA